MSIPANDPGEADAQLPQRLDLRQGLTVTQVLTVEALRGARVLAGASGLNRQLERLTVMEEPDVAAWAKPRELVLTTGYALRERAGQVEPATLVEQLDAAGVAALAVKPGRHLPQLPADLLAAADRRGLPVLRVPDEVAFDDVIEQVLTGVLHQRAAVRALSENVHRALLQIVLDGGGLPEVAAELAGLLGGAAVISTPDGRVLADGGDPQALSEVYGSACFEGTGRLRTEGETAGLSVHPGCPGNHIVVPVVAGRVDHGRIAAFSPEGRLGPDDVLAVEAAATVAALALTKQLAVRAVESKYRGDFLRDLITGRVEVDAAVTHAGTLGWDIDRPMLVVVAELDPGQGHGAATALEARPQVERFAAAWQSVVRPRDARAPVAGFHREVVAVLGEPKGKDVDRYVRELIREVSGDGGGGRRSFSTGVSRVAPTPDGLATAYEQARTAVRVGRRLQGRSALAHFDNLGVFRLLSLVQDPRELRGFAEEVLGDLARAEGTAHELHEMDDLRHTLQVLLDCNLNVAEAARLLHFHYNTLRYRIAKLERMLGPFTADPQLRLSLQIALQVLQMHGDSVHPGG